MPVQKLNKAIRDEIYQQTLAAVSAEINRYTYTGHGSAGFNWLETIWPGNDAIKLRFVKELRQSQGKSVYAEDLKALAADYR